MIRPLAVAVLALLASEVAGSPPRTPAGLHVRRGLAADELHVVCEPVAGATSYRFVREGGGATAWADSTRGVFTGLAADASHRFWCEVRNGDGVARSAPIVGRTLPETTRGHGTLGGRNVGGLYRPTYRVTSLDDRDVPGTLRYGFTRGNAYIIFETPGTILLSDKLRVTSSFVTVDAASSGGRVTLVPHPGDDRGSNPQSGILLDESFPERAHHVILDGLSVIGSRKDNLSIGGDDETSDPDRAAYGVIVRNSVFLRAGDGNLDVVHGAHAITLQGNLYGDNVKNSLINSAPEDTLYAVTVFRNFMVNGKIRNPQTQGRVDSLLVANNVVLNYGRYGFRSQCHVEHGAPCATVTLRADVIGNVFLPRAPSARYDALVHLDGTDAGVYAAGNWSDGVVHEYGRAPRPRVAAYPWIDVELTRAEAEAIVRHAGTAHPTDQERGWIRDAVERMQNPSHPDTVPPVVRGRPRAWESCPDRLRLRVGGGTDDRTPGGELWYRWYLERGEQLRGAPTDSSIWVDTRNFEWGGMAVGETVNVWVRAMDAAGNISEMSQKGRATTRPDTDRPKAINDFALDSGGDPTGVTITIDDTQTRDNCTPEPAYTFFYHLSKTSDREDAIRHGPYPSHIEYVGKRMGNAIVHRIEGLDPQTTYRVWTEVVDAGGNSSMSRAHRTVRTGVPARDKPAPVVPRSFRVRARGDAVLAEGLEAARDIETRLFVGAVDDTSTMRRGEWRGGASQVIVGLPPGARLVVRAQSRRVGGRVSELSPATSVHTGRFAYVAPPPGSPTAWDASHVDRLRWVWKDPGGARTGYRLLWGVRDDPGAAVDSVEVAGTGADSTPHPAGTVIYAWVRTLSEDSISELSEAGRGQTAAR